jgi:hypothetical protein
MPVDPGFPPIAPGRPAPSATGPVPADSVAYFEKATQDFKALGYAVVGQYGGLTAPNVRCYLALFTHPRTGDAAIASAAYGLVGEQWKLQLQHLEVATKLTDGSAVLTNNAAIVNPFPPFAWRTLNQVPEARDAATLDRIHQSVLRHEGVESKARARLDTGAVARELADAYRRELDSAALAGYLFLDPVALEYRPTLKGAYLMTWKMLPPVNQLRASARASRTRTLLREIREVL